MYVDVELRHSFPLSFSIFGIHPVRGTLNESESVGTFLELSMLEGVTLFQIINCNQARVWEHGQPANLPGSWLFTFQDTTESRGLEAGDTIKVHRPQSALKKPVDTGRIGGIRVLCETADTFADAEG